MKTFEESLRVEVDKEINHVINQGIFFMQGALMCLLATWDRRRPPDEPFIFMAKDLNVMCVCVCVCSKVLE